MPKLVTFSNISFNGVKLIWSYNEETNSAILTPIVNGKDAKLKLDDVFAVLKEKNVENLITFDSTAIEITDVKAFARIYPREPYTPRTVSTSPGGRVHLAHEDRVNSLPDDFFMKHSALFKSVKRMDDKLPDENKPISESVEESVSGESVTSLSTLKTDQKPFLDSRNINRKEFKLIHLDALILEKEDVGIWRNTLSIKQVFKSQTSNKLQEISGDFRAISSFNLEWQIKKNNEYYAVKEKLLAKIEELFNHPLNEAYNAWAEQVPIQYRRQVYFFLQGLVNDSMVLEPFCNTLTEYEKMNDEELHFLFHGNKSLQDFAIQQARQMRVQLMLIGFAYLTKPDVSINLVAALDEDDVRNAARLYEELLPMLQYASTPPEAHQHTLAHFKSVVESIDLLKTKDNEFKEGIDNVNQSPKIPKLQAAFSDLHKGKIIKLDNMVCARLKRIALASFKEFLLSKPAIIKEISKTKKKIEKLILEMIEINTKYIAKYKQIEACKEKNPQVIDKYLSFRATMRHFLQSKYSEKIKKESARETICDELVDKLIQTMITEMRNREKQIFKKRTKLPEMDEHDFYLSKEWTISLIPALEKIDSELLKPPRIKNEIEKHAQKFSDFILDFISSRSSPADEPPSEVGLANKP